jgi:predicted AlkP superfamily pyrophosphatase or phosphodiesterase
MKLRLAAASLLASAALVWVLLPAKHEHHVVVISVDGLAPEYYLKPQEFGLNLPNLQQLRDSGSWAVQVLSDYPSLTFPSHTSIVTGVLPARHGIVDNTIFDPTHGSRNWYLNASAIKVPTLWDLARQHGMTTGAVLWPVTIGSRIDFLVPEAFPTPPNMTTLEFIRGVSTPGLIDSIVPNLPTGIVERLSDAEERDRVITLAAIQLIRTYKPNLMLIHLEEADSKQHDFGTHAAEVHQAFVREDAHIGEIVQAVEKAGLRSSTTFVITGDHGFRDVHLSLQPNVILRKAGLLQTNSRGEIAEWKAAARSGTIRIADSGDRDVATRARMAFENLMTGPTRGIFRIVDHAELQSLGADPEAAFMIEPAEGYMASDGFENDEFVIPALKRGAHGFLPANSAMYTGLIVSGYGVIPGVQIPQARLIDIAPTVAKLLGFEMSNIDGAPLTSLLNSRPVPYSAPTAKR